MKATLSTIIIIAFLACSAGAVMKAPEPVIVPVGDPDLTGLSGRIGAESFTWEPLAGTAKNPVAWQAFRHSRSGYIALAVGKPVEFAGNLKDDSGLDEAVRSLWERHAGDWGLKGCKPVIAGVRRLSDAAVVRIEPTIQGYPVYGAYAVLTVNPDGKLAMIKARGFGGRAAGNFSTGEATAVGLARNIAGVPDGNVSVERVFLPVDGSNGIALRAVYQVFLIDEQRPDHRPVLYLDGQKGTILAAENRVCYDDLSGVVSGFYAHRYGPDEPTEASFPEEFLRIDGVGSQFSSVDGEYLFDVPRGAEPYTLRSELRGRWVDVDYEDGADARFQARIDRAGRFDFAWTEDNARLDERGLYRHTNFIHALWKELDEGFDGLDYPVPATSGVNENYDNAFWNGHGMFFGEGGDSDNFALYADVIYHEYGHGVTGNIFPWGVLPYRDEPGALNEAWSDYFPCSITDEPYLGEGGLRGMGGYIRHIDNDYIYPRDLRGEVHLDSRIISAAMWHTREILGRETTDEIVHYARYRLGNDFLTHFADILHTDDDDGDISNGTPHDVVLYEQFGRHGIGPGLEPDLSVASKMVFDDGERGAAGNDNGVFEAGETLRLELEVVRNGSLYPPPAADVRVAVGSDHPAVTIDPAEVSFGDMRVSDRRNGETPILIEIAEDVHLSFATFHLIVTANDGDYERTDSLRIPLGRPDILLVNDGAGTVDRSPWFEAALDELNSVYGEFTVNAPLRTLSSRLDLHEVVIWFTGDAREGMLSEESAVELARFLDGGGRLMLTGQSVGENRDVEWFFSQYLGAANVADSSWDRAVIGVEGDPISDSQRLLLLGSPGAQNQTRPGVVEPVHPAVGIYNWMRERDNPFAGVRREDPVSGAKTIYMAFGVEGISDRRDRGFNAPSQVLDRALEWFGVETSTPPVEPAPPQQFSLGAPYPNPFNSTVVVPVRVNRSGSLELSVFDLSGRLLLNRREAVQTGDSRLLLQAEGWESGVYILRVGSERNGDYRKVTLVK